MQQILFLLTVSENLQQFGKQVLKEKNILPFIHTQRGSLDYSTVC